jgi:hypothetical protein
MEKLDRLGWAAGLAFTAYGVRIGIRVNDPGVLPRVGAHLPPGWRATPSAPVEYLFSLLVGGAGSRPNVRRFSLLYGNVSRLARSMDLDAIFEALESHLQLYIAETARRRVFVHAGVVGWRGRAIIVPGRSHSGKSTLVAAMVRAGAAYYSDEYAVLDAKGRVHPYPKPLSLRDRGTGKAMRCRVEALGGTAGAQPLPVGLVLVSTYKPGATWRPRRITAGHGVLDLLANTVSARRQPAFALAALQQAVAQATMLKGGRGEADEIAPLLLRYLGN